MAGVREVGREGREGERHATKRLSFMSVKGGAEFYRVKGTKCTILVLHVPGSEGVGRGRLNKIARDT